jgi:alpha-glucosidase
VNGPGRRWEVTVVLPASEIGELAKTIKVPLRFLGAGKYQAMLARDQQAEAAAVSIQKATFSRSDSLTIELRTGGGFIARFVK